MLSSRRWWMVMLVLGLCVVASAGCRRKNRKSSATVNNPSEIFTTDNFPGGHVQDNNVSDDKRAMSTSGGDYDNNVSVWFNGNRGPAMVTYSVDGSGASSGITAHYFNGETFSPPVNLRAIDEDNPYTNGDVACVAWVNTENHDSDAARARNGDALLFWTADDADTDVTGADDVNTALFATYFDVSFSEDISHNFGFSDEADTQRIDAQDESDEDVVQVGVLSDGMCGQGIFAFGGSTYKWGDDTTSIECLFVQEENNSGVLDGSAEDQAMYAVRFDPATVASEELPIPATSLTRLTIIGFGASDSGTTSDETQVDYNFMTYNNTLIMRVWTTGFGGPGAPIGAAREFDLNAAYTFPSEDISLETLSFNLATGAISGTSILNSITPVSGDTFGNNAEFLLGTRSLYGSDEGLACTVFYYGMWEDSPSPFPTNLISADLWISEISPSTGGVLEIAQLSDDNPTEGDGISQSDVKIQMSRNGDYIWAAWRQVTDLVAGAANDFSPASDGVFVRQYITTRPDDDGAFVIDTLANTLSANFLAAAPTLTQPVGWYEFQSYLGYICGIQSDADVMHLFFERSNTASDEVFDTLLDADLVPVGVTAGVSVTSFESFEDGDQTTGDSFEGVDSGDGGGIYAAYTDDVDGTATDDFRVFGEDDGPTAGISEIDSDVFFRQAFFDLLIATPPGSEIGHFDTVSLEDQDSRHHGAEFIHTFILESRTSEFYAAQALRTREFITNGESAFVDSFVPSIDPAAYEDPFMFDLPNIDPSSNTVIEGFAVENNSVASWFFFNNRLYYQEFNADGNNGDSELGWRNIEGVGDPALVDDDSDVEIDTVEGLFTQSCSCDTIDRAMIFWVKHFSTDFTGQDRLQVRVRAAE